MWAWSARRCRNLNSVEWKLEDIDREIKDIQKRMRRFLETGDIRRLMRLKVRLAQLEVDLDLLKKKDDLANVAEDLARLEKVTPASFRRSYSYEAFVEYLLTGNIAEVRKKGMR